MTTMQRDSHANVTRDVTRTSQSRSGESKTETKSVTGLTGSVSVRTPSPRETDQLSAAAITLVALRPDWRYDTTRQALATDPRSWRDVIAAGLACALDPQAHPALIATTTPARVVADHGPTPTPPSYAEVLRRQAALEDAS